MEGQFKLIPGNRAETGKNESPVKSLTMEEKIKLEEHLNALMHLYGMSRPTVASLLTIGVLLPEIKHLLNKINLSARVDEIMEALRKDLTKDPEVVSSRLAA